MTYAYTFRESMFDASTNTIHLCKFCLNHWPSVRGGTVERVEQVADRPCEGRHHATRPSVEKLRAAVEHAEQSLRFRLEEQVADPERVSAQQIVWARGEIEHASAMLADRIMSP